MNILKALVLASMFAMHVMQHFTQYGEAENTVSFMMSWPNPDPCDGEECGSSDELMQGYSETVPQESLS